MTTSGYYYHGLLLVVFALLTSFIEGGEISSINRKSKKSSSTDDDSDSDSATYQIRSFSPIRSSSLLSAATIIQPGHSADSPIIRIHRMTSSLSHLRPFLQPEQKYDDVAVVGPVDKTPIDREDNKNVQLITMATTEYSSAKVATGAIDANVNSSWNKQQKKKYVESVKNEKSSGQVWPNENLNEEDDAATSTSRSQIQKAKAKSTSKSKANNNEMLHRLGMSRVSLTPPIYNNNNNNNYYYHRDNDDERKKVLTGGGNVRSRSKSTDDSKMYVVKLPPNPTYYTNLLPCKSDEGNDGTTGSINSQKASKRIRLNFNLNGKPESIYHWNLPLLKLKKKRKTYQYQYQNSYSNNHDHHYSNNGKVHNSSNFEFPIANEQEEKQKHTKGKRLSSSPTTSSSTGAVTSSSNVVAAVLAEQWPQSWKDDHRIRGDDNSNIPVISYYRPKYNEKPIPIVNHLHANGKLSSLYVLAKKKKKKSSSSSFPSQSKYYEVQNTTSSTNIHTVPQL